MYQCHEGQLRVHVIFTTENVVYGQTQINLWILIYSDITYIVLNNGPVRSLNLLVYIRSDITSVCIGVDP